METLNFIPDHEPIVEDPNSIIIFGFPGVGKSYAYDHQEELDLTLQDSDSSKFHWILDENDEPILDENGKKIVHPGWPANYAAYISLTGKEQFKKPDYIFVSTHEESTKAIQKLSMLSFTVVPSKNSKEYYLNLYRERGNDEAFIENMDKNWDSFIDGTIKRATEVEDSYIVMVGPDRPIKNVYDLLKQNPKTLFGMEFEK